MAYEKKELTLDEIKEGPERLLQFLYFLNVIGYDERPENKDEIFIYWCFRDRTVVTLNPKIPPGLNYKDTRKAYSVHSGLQRALRVGGGRRNSF